MYADATRAHVRSHEGPVLRWVLHAGMKALVLKFGHVLPYIPPFAYGSVLLQLEGLETRGSANAHHSSVQPIRGTPHGTPHGTPGRAGMSREAWNSASAAAEGAWPGRAGSGTGAPHGTTALGSVLAEAGMVECAARFQEEGFHTVQVAQGG